MESLKTQVARFLQQEKPRLQKLGVSSVGLFGSVVREEDGPDSDIDILVDIAPDSNLTLFSLIALEQEYSERLQHKVDLVVKADLKPLIGTRILAEVQYV